MTDAVQAEAVRDFIALVDKYGIEEGGWAEFLFWETVEGKRDRPFKLLDKMPEEEMAVLRRLRDEAGLWVFWQDGRWCHTPVDVWRPYAQENTADVMFEKISRANILGT
jgi:hypothetical protein